jgi:hypothetical protein
MYNTNMKRLSPISNKPFKRGDIREDGYLFKQYDLKNKDENGFFYENWRNPKSLNLDANLKKEWYERNKELTKERARAWAVANPNKKKESVDKWRNNNLDKHNATNKNWNKNNKPIKAALQGKRKAAQLQRTPKWLTESELRMIEAKYSLAAMLTRETGTPYHVDHIIPLQGKKVSGLHVFSNLRVIPGTDNVKKSNSYQI